MHLTIIWQNVMRGNNATV